MWSKYFWVMGVVVPLIAGAITSVWFTAGGVRDLRRLFQILSSTERNVLDDGRVVDHMNVDDIAFDKAVEAVEPEQAEALESTELDAQ